MSNADFKRNFSALLARAGAKAEQVVRGSAMAIGASVVARSPVDTGRFRSNWQYGAVAPNTATGAAPDTSGASALGRIATGLQSWRPGETIFLTNSLPYARALEYGHSGQAPGGMVRITVVEFKSYVRTEAERVR